ncbi:MAG TPA: acyl-CoA dehydrogenase family protein, partial [Roseateles sp.]|nr:acyl-CoA dehydrogenase family protein [Roseateles sp.]
RVPQAHGGPGGRIADVMRFIVDLAAADSNIAQALRPGFGFVETLLMSPDAAEHARWYPRLLAGEVFGNAGWERGGANGATTTTLKRQGGHYIAEGLKYYSTGALYADWIGSFALDDEGREVAFLVPRGRPGLALVDDFDAMGQRLTASGTTRYEAVRVEPQERRSQPVQRERRSPLPLLYQLHLAAVEAGIARNALNDAVHFARHHARPIRHSSAARSVDDPYVQQSIGEIAAQAYAAEAVVLRAAEAVDAAWGGGLTQALLTQASIEVSQAQFFAVQAALKAAELLFDVGSASATAREHNHDRHWRNARTVANHNPRHWKAAAVGAWALSGTEPPTSGLF